MQLRPVFKLSVLLILFNFPQRSRIQRNLSTRNERPSFLKKYFLCKLNTPEAIELVNITKTDYVITFCIITQCNMQILHCNPGLCGSLRQRNSQETSKTEGDRGSITQNYKRVQYDPPDWRKHTFPRMPRETRSSESTPGSSKWLLSHERWRQPYERIGNAIWTKSQCFT